MFQHYINATNTIEHLITILSSAYEYEELPVRHNENKVNESFATLLSHNFNIEQADYDSPFIKCEILLRARFQRLAMPMNDYKTDLNSILDQAIRIPLAMLDIAAHHGYYQCTLHIMTLLQMITQALWYDTSSLYNIIDQISSNQDQIQHIIQLLKDQLKIITLSDLYQAIHYNKKANLTIKKQILEQNQQQYHTLSQLVNEIPMVSIKVIQMKKKCINMKQMKQMKQQMKQMKHQLHCHVISIKLHIKLVNQPKYKKISCPFWGKKKEYSWWIVIGNKKTDVLYVVKRTTIHSKYTKTIHLQFKLNEHTPSLQLKVISDSFLHLEKQIILDINSLYNLEKKKKKKKKKEEVIHNDDDDDIEETNGKQIDTEQTNESAAY